MGVVIVKCCWPCFGGKCGASHCKQSVPCGVVILCPEGCYGDTALHKLLWDSLLLLLLLLGMMVLRQDAAVRDVAITFIQVLFSLLLLVAVVDTPGKVVVLEAHTPTAHCNTHIPPTATHMSSDSWNVLFVCSLFTTNVEPAVVDARHVVVSGVGTHLLLTATHTQAVRV